MTMLNTLKRLDFRKKTVENRAKNVTHRREQGENTPLYLWGIVFHRQENYTPFFFCPTFLFLFLVSFTVFFFTTSDYGFAAEDPNQGDDW